MRRSFLLLSGVPLVFGCAAQQLSEMKDLATKGQTAKIASMAPRCAPSNYAAECVQIWAIHGRALLAEAQKASPKTFCSTTDEIAREQTKKAEAELGMATAHDSALGPSERAILRGDRARALYCLRSDNSASVGDAASLLLEAAKISPPVESDQSFRFVAREIARASATQSLCGPARALVSAYNLDPPSKTGPCGAE